MIMNRTSALGTMGALAEDDKELIAEFTQDL